MPLLIAVIVFAVSQSLLGPIVWAVYVFIIDFGSGPIWSGSLFLDFIFMTMGGLLTFS